MAVKDMEHYAFISKVACLSHRPREWGLPPFLLANIGRAFLRSRSIYQGPVNLIPDSINPEWIRDINH